MRFGEESWTTAPLSFGFVSEESPDFVEQSAG